MLRGMLSLGMILILSGFLNPAVAGEMYGNFSAYEEEETELQHTSMIPVANDFALEADAAKKSGLPILVMFSAADCNFCVKLEDEVLNPMYISGDYTNRVIIRKVMIDNYESIRDFNGGKLDSGDFADKYSVSVTPTVMLMDSKGNVIAPKILGINTVELYSAYLDRAIDYSYGVIHNTVN